MGKRVEVAVADENKFTYRNDKPKYKIEKIFFEKVIEKIQLIDDKDLHYYIMQKSMSEEYPELMPDIETPFWLNGKCRAINFWFGSGGNFTPLHYDLLDNFIAQIFGSKHFTLYDPSQMELLYPNSVINDHAHVSRVDITNPNYSLYPEFKQAKPTELTLHAGEMLYLSTHWWHAVKSIDVNAMVNFWSPGNDLELYLSNPTGIRSLWFIYKENVLQSLKYLIQKNGMRFIDCAEQVLPISPAASILFSHAESIDFILLLNINGSSTHKTIDQLTDHITTLVKIGMFSNDDIEIIRKWRFVALQTFTDSDPDIKQAQEIIFEVKDFILKFIK